MTAQAPGTRLVAELRLLLDVVADRAGPWLDRVSGEPAEHVDIGCRPRCSCPLCAALAIVRGEPNELAARTLDRAADLVAVLRAVLADRLEPGAPHMPGFAAPPRPAGDPPRVQRIPVRRKGDPEQA